MWHQFNDEDDPAADVECVTPDCGVILAPRVLGVLTLDCPVSPCTAPTNRGGACVFAPAGAGCTCTYCGRPGSKSCGAP